MKGYSEGLLFDNERGGETGVEFSLEAAVRSVAQRMIEGALEAEVGVLTWAHPHSSG